MGTVHTGVEAPGLACAVEGTEVVQVWPSMSVLGSETLNAKRQELAFLPTITKASLHLFSLGGLLRFRTVPSYVTRFGELQS